MNNTKKSSVCSVLALMALQPFAMAQDTAPVTPVVPAVETPANTETTPVAKEAVAGEKASGLYSNEKAEFSGDGRPIKQVLKDIAELYSFNVVIPDELDGPVTDSFKNIKWQDFYSQILAKKGYVWRIENEMAVVEKEKTDLKKNIKKLESGNISVDFNKAPVADAVAAICEVMEKNFSPLPAELEGTAPAAPGAPATGPKLITIKWKGVSWQRTLAEILAKDGYGFKEEDGIIRVLLLSELNNVPSETRVYRLTFADAKIVSETISGIFKSADPKNPTPLTASYESGQQLVIVTARPEFLRNKESEILSLVAQIDQPAKQVIIESKIVERSVNNGFNLGFRYGYGSGNGAATGNATTNKNTAKSGNESSSAVTTGVLSGANSGTDPQTFSAVLSEHDFKFFLDALETDKTANILQNPSVVVKDDGSGAIRVIRRVPYFEVTSTQGTGATQLTSTTKFINVGTSMYIKPKIKGNGFVELKIDQTAGGGALTGGGSSELQEGNGGLSISAQDGNATAPAIGGAVGTSVPITNNRDVRTTVLLRDGYTVALGGLIKDGDNKSNSQVPILGDIPVLGRLFQSQTTSKDKTNLMAFITARIVDPYNSNYRDMLGLDRVNDLNLSSREIEGGSFRISDAERESLDELMHKRDLDANATKSQSLNRELNGSAN